jgi:hypothetical protein
MLSCSILLVFGNFPSKKDLFKVTFVSCFIVMYSDFYDDNHCGHIG